MFTRDQVDFDFGKMADILSFQILQLFCGRNVILYIKLKLNVSTIYQAFEKENSPSEKKSPSVKQKGG